MIYEKAAQSFLSSGWPTEVISVKRRTWRTLWLVKRTFRVRVPVMYETVVLNKSSYEVQ